MEDIRKALGSVASSLQDVDHSQRAMNRDLKALTAKSDDMVTQIAELRSNFAGLAQAVEKLFDQVQDHESRLRALEDKKAS